MLRPRLQSLLDDTFERCCASQMNSKISIYNVLKLDKRITHYQRDYGNYTSHLIAFAAEEYESDCCRPVMRSLLHSLIQKFVLVQMACVWNYSTADSSSRSLFDYSHDPFRWSVGTIPAWSCCQWSLNSTALKIEHTLCLLACFHRRWKFHPLFGHVLLIPSVESLPFRDHHGCFDIAFQLQILSWQWFLTGLWNAMMN
jgi:hypothetical protein